MTDVFFRNCCFSLTWPRRRHTAAAAASALCSSHTTLSRRHHQSESLTKIPETLPPPYLPLLPPSLSTRLPHSCGSVASLSPHARISTRAPLVRAQAAMPAGLPLSPHHSRRAVVATPSFLPFIAPLLPRHCRQADVAAAVSPSRCHCAVFSAPFSLPVATPLLRRCRRAPVAVRAIFDTLLSPIRRAVGSAPLALHRCCRVFVATPSRRCRHTVVAAASSPPITAPLSPRRRRCAVVVAAPTRRCRCTVVTSPLSLRRCRRELVAAPLWVPVIAPSSRCRRHCAVVASQVSPI